MVAYGHHRRAGRRRARRRGPRRPAPEPRASPTPGCASGIFDIDEATLERIGRGEMPFLENGADELLPRVLATGRLELEHVRRDDRPRRGRDPRHRHARGRVPRPVDARLRACRGPDRAAPRGRRPRRPAQHRLPGHDRVRRRRARRSAAAAWTSRSARSGSPRATRSRSCASLPQIIGADDAGRRRPGGGPLRPPGGEDDPDDQPGGRAHQAVHQHLALHEVRRREPVLRDRGPGGRGLHERPARHPRGLPARRGPARARASPPGPCLFKDTMQLAAFTSDHFPLGQAAMQINEGMPAYIVVRAGAAPRQPARPDGRHPRHGVQGRVGRHPRLAQLQAAQAPRVGRARACCAPTRTSTDDAPRRRSTRSSRGSEILVIGAPHRAYRVARPGRSRGRRHLERDRRRDPALVDEGPRHRRRRVHLRLPRRGAARGRPRGRRRRQLQQVRPRRQVLRRPPALPVRRGRREGRRAAHGARGGRGPGASPRPR